MTRLFLILFVLMTLFAVPIGTATANEPLFLGEARVDIMGETADDARALGLKQAKRDALAKLFGKFVPEHKSSLMDNLTDKKIEKLVRNIEMSNESVDGNRFRADIRISYSAAMFNDLITNKIEAVESDQQLLTTASLILPIFEAEDRLYLFETNNPWAVAWANVSRNVGRGQLITPFGDSVDYSMISAEKADKANFKAFAALRRRYGVRDVVVLHAKFLTKPAFSYNLDEKQEDDNEDDEEDGNKKKHTLVLQVEERRVQAREDEIKRLEYIMDAGESKETLMERAARDLGVYVMTMQGQTANDVAESQKKFNTILLVMPVTTMQRFAWIKERLANVPGVDRLEIMAIKPKQADVRMYYTGTREVLLESMGELGLKFDDRTKYLEIRL